MGEASYPTRTHPRSPATPAHPSVPAAWGARGAGGLGAGVEGASAAFVRGPAFAGCGAVVTDLDCAASRRSARRPERRERAGFPPAAGPGAIKPRGPGRCCRRRSRIGPVRLAHGAAGPGARRLPDTPSRAPAAPSECRPRPRRDALDALAHPRRATGVLFDLHGSVSPADRAVPRFDPVDVAAAFDPSGGRRPSGEWRGGDAPAAIEPARSSTGLDHRRTAPRRMPQTREREDFALAVPRGTVNPTGKRRDLGRRPFDASTAGSTARDWSA